jgi:hypothetical protein
MTRPSSSELLGETARLAFHLHWPLDTILDLEHADRRRFLREAEAMAAEASAGLAPSGAEYETHPLFED